MCARGEGHRLRVTPGDIRYLTIFLWAIVLTERGRERGIARARATLSSGACVFFGKKKCALPNVSYGLGVHAILFSQCSAARAHELGILRALRVNVLGLHHHNTERKQLM